MRIFAEKRRVIMNRRIVLIALAALTLISTGCSKKHNPSGGAEGEPESNVLSITGAPESAVLVGGKFSLTVESLANMTSWKEHNTIVVNKQRIVTIKIFLLKLRWFKCLR